MSLKRNEFETHDSRSILFPESQEGVFYNKEKHGSSTFKFDELTQRFFSIDLSLDPQRVMHEREVYNILDLFGDLGGVNELLNLIFSLVALPISQHSFILKAL